MSIWLLLITAVSAFVLGAVWYGPLFHTAWCRENGFPEDHRAANPVRVFGVSFLFTFFAAAGYAHLFGFTDNLVLAAIEGAAAGAFIAATSFGINYQFTGKSIRLWLIDGGYHTLQFALIGVLFAALHEIV